MQPFEQLEVEWAKFNDLDPAGMVACSSGTAALHLALEAFQLPKGSQVLVPDYTMIACPRAVTMAGLEPRFIDCNDRLLINTDSLKLDPKTSAIMGVHVYGRRCRVDYIADCVGWKKAYAGGWDRIKLVEDLAEAHGVKPHPRTDASCWSFYKNKIVAGEEGGAVWFRNPDHAKLARSLRTLGFTDAHDYTHVPRGHNYRMSNLHADLILSNLRSYVDTASPFYDWHTVKGVKSTRREIESWYDRYCPDEWKQPTRDAVWVYDIRIPEMTSTVQSKIVTALREKGIEARYGFKPCRRQEEYSRTFNGLLSLDWVDKYGTWREVWESDKASLEVIYFPVQPGVTTEADARRTFEIIKQAIGS